MLFLVLKNHSLSGSHRLMKKSCQQIPAWSNPQSFDLLLLFSAWREHSAKSLERLSPREYIEYKRMYHLGLILKS